MRAAHRWAAAGLLLLLLLAAALRIGSLRFDYHHPDEIISVKVAERMVDAGTLDTNWRHADLPIHFKQPQYNFSGYLLGAAAVLQVRQWWPVAEPAPPGDWLRAWSAVLGVVVVGLTFAVGRLFFGTATGLVAAVCACFFPLLYQDSLYARPETWVTALTLGAVGLLAAPRPVFRGAHLLAAFLMGLLVATKVSMALLLPLLLLALRPPAPAASLRAWGPPDPRPRWARAWDRARWLPLALLAGFVAGAPHALANLDDYFAGIEFLRHQYNEGHWPHGIEGTGYGPVVRIDHAKRYFEATSGWLPALSFAGAAIALARRQLRPLAAFAVALATALQFSAYPTFFERNLSHVVPLLLIFSAYGVVAPCALAARTPALRAALTAAILLLVLQPALRTTATLRFEELPDKPGKRLAALRASLRAQLGVEAMPVRWRHEPEAVRQAMLLRCDGPVLVELMHPDDLRSQQLLHVLDVQDNLRPVARLPSLFAHVPTSTLHTYFRATSDFLYRAAGTAPCRTLGGGRVAAPSVGAPLPVADVRAGPGWTLGGASLVANDFEGGRDFHGSWSGSDANTGQLTMTVFVEGAGFLVLPYLTGPTAARQWIRVRDPASGAVLLEEWVPQSYAWQFRAVRVPPGTRALVVEAVDEGDGWGEWQAIGRPRRLKDD
jgi:hypothetical protein